MLSHLDLLKLQFMIFPKIIKNYKTTPILCKVRICFQPIFIQIYFRSISHSTITFLHFNCPHQLLFHQFYSANFNSVIFSPWTLGVPATFYSAIFYFIYSAVTFLHLHFRVPNLFYALNFYSANFYFAFLFHCDLLVFTLQGLYHI